MNTAKQILTFGLFIKAALLSFNGGLAFAGPSKKVNKAYKEMSLQEVEVVLERHLKGIDARGLVEPLAQHLISVSKRYGFKPDFVLSIIQVESGFRVNAESNVGALGLMQLMPETALYISHRFQVFSYQKPSDLSNPFVNITLGVQYLSYLRGRFVRTDRVLAAYNMGPNKFKRRVRMNVDHPALVHRYIQDIHRNEKAMKQKAQSLLVATL